MLEDETTMEEEKQDELNVPTEEEEDRKIRIIYLCIFSLWVIFLLSAYLIHFSTKHNRKKTIKN
jgi:hypothetical protein